jgi:hypothetical protein
MTARRKIGTARSGGDRLAIARDVEATIGKVEREASAGVLDELDNNFVTAFLDSIEIDDRQADQLWERIPVDDLNDVEASDLARRVASHDRTSSTGLGSPMPATGAEAKRSFGVARRLRGPRHPFE